MKAFTQENLALTKITFLDNEETFEGLYLPTDSPRGLVVFIHGHNTFGAWELLFQSQRLLKEGYAVFLPSQAGFGGSRAKRDYCGPRTVAAVEKLFEHLLAANSDLESLPVQVWGISRGATVAAKFAVGKHSGRVVSAILQSGVYDHEKNYLDPKKPEKIRKNILTETGGEASELKKRSFIFDVDQVNVPLLIIHGENDENVDVNQAYALHTELKSANKDYELRIIQGAGHILSGPTHFRELILPFLRTHQ